MKKITFLLLTLLITSYNSNAQVVDWVNELAWNSPVQIGQTISLEIDYDGQTADVNWVKISMERFDTSTSPFWTSLEAYNTGSQTPVGDSDPNSGTGLMVNYEIPADVPLTSSLPANETIMIMVVMQYNDGSTGWASNNIGVTVQEPLGLEDYSVANKPVFYPNPVRDNINIKNLVQAKTYQIRNISGQLIRQGDFSTKINVSNLNAGIYFIGIDNNYAKFIKD